MKKSIFVLFLLISFASLTHITKALADDSNIYKDANGLSYIEINGGYSVVNYSGSSTQITIPNVVNGLNVTSIGNYAFYGHTMLTKVTLPNEVTSIGDFAFYYCKNLTDINIPSKVTSIGKGSFLHCTSLTSIDIPSGVKIIESATFWDCTNLTSINMPGGVTSIDDYAFRGCASLTSIDIPSGVRHIGEYAFSNCTNLTNINLPSGLTDIEWRAFTDCTSLRSINLPSGVTSIGLDTFSGCTNLINVSLPSGLTSIGWSAFEGCTSLTNIDLPSGLSNIDRYAFAYCTSLKNINIPSGVTSLSDSIFEGCTNLTSINIPSGVTSIGDHAFYFCHNLTNINLPSGVTEIGDYAFKGCTSLKSITIPFAVNFIEGSSAFDNDITILGYLNSYAYTFATSHGYMFQSIGDANNLSFTIIFYTNSEISTITAYYNTKLTAPKSPIRAGYTFGGWYKEANCIRSWNFSTDKVTNNLTLYAKWIANPTAPISAKAVSSSYDSINITWAAVSDVNGYEIFRATSNTGAYSFLKSTTNLTYTNTGLVTSKTYYYKVRTYKIVGSTKVYSEFSTVVSAKPIPPTPTNLKAARASSSSIKLTWSGVKGASGYEIYKATSITGAYSLLKFTTTLSLTNTGLDKGRTYYYKVRAYRIVGLTKVYSNWTSVVYAKTY